MIRHVAAAVLYAAITVVGSMNISPAVGPGGDDDDDDSSVECVEYASGPSHRKSSAVLAVATSLCREQIDKAWVVADAHGPAAAVAVHHQGEHVAVIDLAEYADLTSTNDGAGNDALAKGGSVTGGSMTGASGKTPPSPAVAAEESHLLDLALTACRESGALKLVVHVPAMQPDAIRALVESRGYQHARTRTDGNSVQHEFYTDLYRADRPPRPAIAT